MPVGLVKGFVLWASRQDSLPLFFCPLSLFWDEHVTIATILVSHWLWLRWPGKGGFKDGKAL